MVFVVDEELVYEFANVCLILHKLAHFRKLGLVGELLLDVAAVVDGGHQPLQEPEPFVAGGHGIQDHELMHRLLDPFAVEPLLLDLLQCLNHSALELLVSKFVLIALNTHTECKQLIEGGSLLSCESRADFHLDELLVEHCLGRLEQQVVQYLQAPKGTARDLIQLPEVERQHYLVLGGARVDCALPVL